MDRLIEGFRRFRDLHWGEQRTLFEDLARGQSPRAMVITCSDSRVDPHLIFSTAPGELFVVRNVASLVPPFTSSADHHGTSAALEFAVRALKVDHIVVLGHAQCGGIGALLNGAPPETSDFVPAWMSIAARARERALAAARAGHGEAQHLCELEGVKVSLENLMTFPWVREPVAAGTLQLHGMYFDIGHGALLRLAQDGAFATVAG